MSFCARSMPARRVFREAAGQVISRKGLTSLARSGTASEDKDAGDRPESRASVGHAFKPACGESSHASHAESIPVRLRVERTGRRIRFTWSRQLQIDVAVAST
jgi:hypothetical protein